MEILTSLVQRFDENASDIISIVEELLESELMPNGDDDDDGSCKSELICILRLLHDHIHKLNYLAKTEKTVPQQHLNRARRKLFVPLSYRQEPFAETHLAKMLCFVKTQLPFSWQKNDNNTETLPSKTGQNLYWYGPYTHV